MIFNKKKYNSGFFQTIIIIIVAILIIKYLNISISDVFNWLKSQLQGIF